MNHSQLQLLLTGVNAVFAGAMYTRESGAKDDTRVDLASLTAMLVKLETALAYLAGESATTLVRTQHPDVYLNSLAASLEKYVADNGPIAAGDPDADVIAGGFQQLRLGLDYAVPQPAAAFANPRLYVDVAVAKLRVIAAIEALFASQGETSAND